METWKLQRFHQGEAPEGGKDLQCLPFLPHRQSCLKLTLKKICISHPAPPGTELSQSHREASPPFQLGFCLFPEPPVLVFNLTHRALLPRRFLRCSNPSILLHYPTHCPHSTLQNSSFPVTLTGKEGGDVLPALLPSPVPPAAPAVLQ